MSNDLVVQGSTAVAENTLANRLDPLFLEKVVLKSLFKKDDVRERIIPFLTPQIFHTIEAKIITKHILQFKQKYNNFPTFNEIQLEIEDDKYITFLNECILLDTSQYSDSHLLDKTEDFIKQSLLFNVFSEAVEHVDSGKLSEIDDMPDKLREIVSFSFNTKIGLDLFSEEGEEAMFDYLHNVDKVVPTNIPYFNNLIKGGFHEKSLTLFLLSVNKGKSLIMCSLACDALLNNKKVLYITLEMEKRMIGERILANLFDVNMDDLVFLSREKIRTKFQVLREKVKQNLIVQEYPTKSINANHLRTLVKELKVKKNFEAELILLDYMGLMVPIHINKNDNSYTEQKRISEEVRGVAGEIGTPIVSGIQTNRDGAESTDVDMTNIADSFGSAMTADLIVAGTQSDEMREAGKYVWTIVKNRYGRNKLRFRVNVDFPKMRVTADEEELANMCKKETPRASRIVDEASVIALKTMSNSRATARADKKITIK
jgi:hypothetical protein